MLSTAQISGVPCGVVYAIGASDPTGKQDLRRGERVSEPEEHLGGGLLTQVREQVAQMADGAVT